MSVGCKFVDYKVQDMEGLKVWILKEADLQEISFVKRGAIEPAFGILVDQDSTLAQAMKTSMPSDGAYIEDDARPR